MVLTVPSTDEIRAIVREEIRSALRELAADVQPEGISTAEAAKLAGVSEKTIKRAVRDDEIQSTRVRGRRVIQRSSVLTWRGERTIEIAHRAREE